ncbi:AraC family transcriptional regulator [Sandaracinus amylolyticus]|uniref:AraC family transcriptional regulator n=1 Tax=Sandaracinus amylolyticus TaxID=927083 RepID=UPI001F25815A|nr:AraC family transcriptional regulator [Sandaracinus amylolyticus]
MRSTMGAAPSARAVRRRQSIDLGRHPRAKLALRSVPATVLAALPATLLVTLARLGHDADAVRARAGIDASALGDPDARIPFAAHARLWEEIAALGGDVGLALGERLGTAALGVVGHAMSRAETVGDAWSVLERFRRLVLDDAVPRLRVEGDEAHLVQPLPARFARLRHPAECQAATTITTLRALVGARFDARHVAFQHAAPASIDAHRALFGTRDVVFGAAANELVIDASIRLRPNVRADPALRDYLVRRAGALEAELGEDDRLADRARREIAAALASGEPSADVLARTLGTSSRTLHRRLAAEGTSVAALLDETRRERALALVADPARSVGAIAFALGYRDATTFTRAFRRWTGVTPGAWRRA